MTNNIIDVVFIRHAEPDYTEPDDYKRDLTSTGKEQANNLVQEFKNMEIARIYSSPFLRAISTLRPLAKERGLPIHVIDELRERKSSGYRLPDNEYVGLAHNQWNDYYIKFRGGESLYDTRERYNKAVNHMLDCATKDDQGKLLAGCHITGLCAYLSQFGIINTYQEFARVAKEKPWVVTISYDRVTRRPVSIRKAGSYKVF